MNTVTNQISGRVPAVFTRSACAFLVLTVILAAFFPVKVHASTGTPIPAPMPRTELVVAKAQSRVAPGLPMRVYGNSVIPGGVHGSSELTSALGRDKIARAHYADFDAANAYVVHIKSARQVHVSYRMGNDIYWTKNKVRLAKGEALLTDGKSFVRVRCGNRIAKVPQSMVSNREPAPEILDTVLAPSPGAVSLTNHSPDSTGPKPAAADGLLNNAGNFAASDRKRALMPALVEGFDHGVSPAVEAFDHGVSPVVVPFNHGVSPVLVSTPTTEVTLPDLLVPPTDILAMPEVLPPFQVNENDVGPILAAVPSTLPDVVAPPQVLIPNDKAAELPEPGSFALVMLALILMALTRRRDQRI